MRRRISSSDFSRVLACIEAVHGQTNAELLPTHLLETLCKLVPCRLAGFTQVDPVFGESSGVLFPAGPRDADVFACFQKNIHEHPVVSHAQQTRDGRALAISDFLSPRQFHSTGLYREVFQPLGLEDQLSIGMVGQAGLIIGLSLNRTRRGFSDRDRAVLNLMRPHVLQAFLYARSYRFCETWVGFVAERSSINYRLVLPALIRGERCSGRPIRHDGCCVITFLMPRILCTVSPMRCVSGCEPPSDQDHRPTVFDTCLPSGPAWS